VPVAADAGDGAINAKQTTACLGVIRFADVDSVADLRAHTA